MRERTGAAEGSAPAFALAIVLALHANPAWASDATTGHISGWHPHLPFQSTVSFNLEGLGVPDLVGVCVAGSLFNAGFEACGGTVALVSSGSVHVSWSVFYADLMVSDTPGHAEYRGAVYTFGLLTGARVMTPWPELRTGGGSSRPNFYVGPDFGAQIATLHWQKAGWGLRVACEGGVFWAANAPSVGPFFEVQVGLVL